MQTPLRRETSTQPTGGKTVYHQLNSRLAIEKVKLFSMCSFLRCCLFQTKNKQWDRKQVFPSLQQRSSKTTTKPLSLLH